MWQQIIERVCPDCTFFPPATPIQIAKVEQTLKVILSEDIKGLLMESNGVWGDYGLGLIWSTERIIEENALFRSRPRGYEDYLPFEPYLFFADAGDGELFALPIVEGSIRRPDIYVWNPIDDSRFWVASSLQDYLERWLTGKLSL
jgi:hypothetical protein